RQPGEERLERIQSRKQRCLAQRFACPFVDLARKMSGEADRLLLAEGLEVLVARIALEAAQGLRDRVDRRFALATRTLEMGEIVALDADIFSVALVHASPSFLMSQSTEGRLVSLIRTDGSVNVTSSFPRTASIWARLATRWMSRPQVGQ